MGEIVQDVFDYLEALRASAIDDLIALLRIPSISACPSTGTTSVALPTGWRRDCSDLVHHFINRATYR